MGGAIGAKPRQTPAGDLYVALALDFARRKENK